MNRWLKRSRAQSRDPAARRQAVASEPLDSLGQSLHEFARSDRDASVRTAALQRAADLDLAQQCMQDDADSTVQQTAERLYRSLLSGSHVNAPSVDERMKRLGELENRELLEYLARHGREASLREAALRKIDRPGLTLECVLNDPDPALRLRLLDGIDDLRQLQQIADKSRRRDKQLHRQAGARLRAMHLASGDPEALRQEAEQLCRELERLPGGQASQEAIDALDRQWQLLGDNVDPVLRTRHDNARAQAIAAAQAKLAPTAPPAAVAQKMPRMAEPEHPSKPVQASSPEVQKLVAENRFQADVAVHEKPPPAERPKKPRKDLSPVLDELESALEAGNLAESDKLLRKIQPHHKDLPQKLSGRWHRAQERVSELKRWQHWSNRRQRRQLCVDARAMRASSQHPEAIANRIRELRQQWNNLDALEPGSARTRPADAALKRRFHALCHRALEPTRPWFEKRDALRTEHGQRIEALLVQQAPEEDDWKGLAARRRELASARRDLDKVDPRTRKSLARRLGKAIEKLDAPLDEHYQKIRKAHERLIEQAQALMELDAGKRTAAAKDLQSQWQAMGPGRRDLDRKQWRAFRKAMDAVFQAREQEQKEQAEQSRQARQEALQLLDTLQASAAANEDSVVLLAALRDARQQWRALDLRDKALSQRFDSLRQDIEQRARELDAEKHRQRYRDWLAAAESSQAGDDMPAVLRDAISTRTDATADTGSVRTLLVRMEALAGVDSPAEDHDARMQINLERLQASMGHGHRENPREQLDALLAQWIALNPSADDDSPLRARFNAAFEGILARVQP